MKTNNTKRNRNSSAKKSIINVDYLNELSGGNSSFINAMFHAFRDESRIFLRQMDQVIVNQDFLSVKRIAHRMKPAGAYIGADSLTLMVSNLELAADQTNSSEAATLFQSIKGLLKNIFTEIDSYLDKKASLN